MLAAPVAPRPEKRRDEDSAPPTAPGRRKRGGRANNRREATGVDGQHAEASKRRCTGRMWLEERRLIADRRVWRSLRGGRVFASEAAADSPRQHRRRGSGRMRRGRFEFHAYKHSALLVNPEDVEFIEDRTREIPTFGRFIPTVCGRKR
jgi:hypothetical protein